jgi:MinD superfamily P-loop ATPase
MKELVVISGKGGTGKTSLVASFAALASSAVVVDCDVDAADLHLVLEPQVQRSEDFVGGSKARINPERCMAHGQCAELCRFGAISFDGPGNDRVPQTYRIEPLACEGCGVCVDHCPKQAIELAPVVCGQWFISQTRCGPMVHAQLGVAADNSGKLVTHLRRTAQQLAVEHQRELILCDGSPGIGCPVIASLTAASLALFVVEPTVSGLHDFRRVAELAGRLGVPGMLAVNKADLNAVVAEQLEALARQLGIAVAGRVPYDGDVTRAQVARRTVVEVSDGPAARAIRALWTEVQQRLQANVPTASGGLVPLTSYATSEDACEHQASAMEALVHE